MSRLNLVRRNDAPLPPYDCEMVQCDVAFVPFILGALWQRSQRYWWAQAEDQQLGRWGMNKQMMEVLMPCGQDIVAAVDRVYMLLNTTLNGIYYTHSGLGTPADPYVIEPEIEVTPGILEFQTGSMADKLYGAAEALDNLATGNPNFRYSDTRNPRQQLDDILAAIGSGSFDDTEVLAKLAQIIVALG